jgi:hypothetical protein
MGTEDRFESLRQEVRDAFTVTTHAAIPDRHFQTVVRYVEADAGTGTRYTVVATTLPGGHGEGGPVLVTVLHPWTAAFAFQEDGYLAESYVAEHLCPRDPTAPEDLTAITLLVRHVLDRTGEP